MRYRMPAEWEGHAYTVMALPSHSWWEDGLRAARGDVFAIAKAIAQYEPVKLLVHPEDAWEAYHTVSPDVEVVVESFGDCWVRDTGPTMVRNGAGRLAGVTWRFNAWGQKYDLTSGSELAADVTLAARLLRGARIPTRPSMLAFEGGNVCSDGDGSLLVSESAVLHPKRNPGVAKTSVELELCGLLGADKVIWVPGNLADHMTDGHIDGIAMFVAPAIVLSEVPADKDHPEYAETMACRRVLEQSTDAKGRQISVLPLTRPRHVPSDSPDFSACYSNFYLANGCVILPAFGDVRADGIAQETLEMCFPERDVVQMRMDGLQEGGGSVHCCTCSVPTGAA